MNVLPSIKIWIIEKKVGIHTCIKINYTKLQNILILIFKWMFEQHSCSIK